MRSLPRRPLTRPWKKTSHSLIPTLEVCVKAAEHVKEKLGEKLWNHSHRAFLFATETELTATKTSFEFHSAVLAREYLLSLALDDGSRVVRDLVDSVCEAVWRHTNFIDSQITVTGQCNQLGTLFDNAFANSSWIHPVTVANVVELFPRNDWVECFHNAMKKEIELKPWSHTTAFDYAAVDGTAICDVFLRDDLAKTLENEEKKEQHGKV
ncbi:hypothetical protein JCM11251_002299 [Rhodosporidiobolus azoricus]